METSLALFHPQTVSAKQHLPAIKLFDQPICEFIETIVGAPLTLRLVVLEGLSRTGRSGRGGGGGGVGIGIDVPLRPSVLIKILHAGKWLCVVPSVSLSPYLHDRWVSWW